VQSQRGTQYFIILESPDSTTKDSVTAWASSANPYPNGYLFQYDGSTNVDLAFRVFAVADGSGIEYYTWWNFTSDHWDRKIYRDKSTDISMTFGDP
jgi:hypothetical protein